MIPALNVPLEGVDFPLPESSAARNTILILFFVFPSVWPLILFGIDCQPPF